MSVRGKGHKRSLHAAQPGPRKSARLMAASSFAVPAPSGSNFATHPSAIQPTAATTGVQTRAMTAAISTPPTAATVRTGAAAAAAAAAASVASTAPVPAPVHTNSAIQPTAATTGVQTRAMTAAISTAATATTVAAAAATAVSTAAITTVVATASASSSTAPVPAPVPAPVLITNGPVLQFPLITGQSQLWMGPLSSAVVMTLEELKNLNPQPSPDEPVGLVPIGWTSSERRIAAQLAHQFWNTRMIRKVKTPARLSPPKPRLVQVVLLPPSKLSERYEAEAKRLGETTIPVLDRTLSPSSEPRSLVASKTGSALEKLGFHGTRPKNIPKILDNGFYDPNAKKIDIGLHGTRYGKAIYLCRRSDFSDTYCGSSSDCSEAGIDPDSRQMIGCVAIAHSGELFADVYAITETFRVRPLVLFHFPRDL
jgi:hypothetical protein